MKKILLAINAVAPDTTAVDFACHIAKLTDSVLTGVFLENLEEDKRLAVRNNPYEGTYINFEIDENSAAYRLKKQTIEKNVSLFSRICEKKGVRSNLYMDGGRPFLEIIDESRFADLLIVDVDTTFKKVSKGVPSGLVKQILKRTACPVIIAPEAFDSLHEIIFFFDGKMSSMYAIRQFTYLFPQLLSHKLTVLHIGNTGNLDNVALDQLKEWLLYHYKNVSFKNLDDNTADTLFDYLLKYKNAMLVMGAYGRSNISRLFRQSQLDTVLKALPHAVFIAHC